ncbi:ribose-phosphate pyrophosphokinase [Candidatus Woesearchaeota archaeon]|nr:ribose-phosphate pyrophosphokinase [Candidatus Woesearchaeota archaeon]
MKERKLSLIASLNSQELAAKVSEHLTVPLKKIDVEQFKNGEIYVKAEESVRGTEVFIIHAPTGNLNENFIGLLVLIDALKRASAGDITVVMPYFIYSRQDKQAAVREPITARLVANLLETSGINRMVTFDLHSGAIQGFFNVATDNISAIPVFAKYFIEKSMDNIVVVSPDAGGTKRARSFAQLLNAPLAVIDKRRTSHNVATALHVLGDVEGKHAIIIDDIIDTAGSIVEAARCLKEKGALDIYAAATHGVFSEPAFERIKGSPFKEVLVTDSLPLSHSQEKIRVLSIAQILAEAIDRIHSNEPLSDMSLFKGTTLFG